MVALKLNPVGVDVVIQDMQSAMYAELVRLWQIDNDTDYACYGRAYRLQVPNKDAYVPEVFIGGKDYKEVFLDDRVKALSYFQYDRNAFKLMNTAPVSLIFWVNVTKVKPDVEHRADEEVRVDVANFIAGYLADSSVTISTFTGIDKVFSEYSAYRSAEGIKHRDMHPYHCFRINFNLPAYDSTSNC